MLNRIIEQEQAIWGVLMEMKKTELMPSREEFKTIEQLCELLKPLNDMSDFFSSSTTTTISGILPCIFELENLLNDGEDGKDTPAIASAKRAMRAKLSDIYERRYILDVMQMSTFLDARFKSMPFFSEARVQQVHDLVSRDALLMQANAAAPDLAPPAMPADAH